MRFALSDSDVQIESGTYYCEVRMVDPSSLVRIVAKGRFVVRPTITGA